MRTAALCLLAAGMLARAQDERALMNARQTNELFARCVQLMESSAVAIPELDRAGAPLIENARQAALNLQARPENSRTTFGFVTNVRAYVLVTDSVPRPFPFPAEASRQLAELRDTLSRAEVHLRALLDDHEAQLRSADPDDLTRYAENNQALPQPVPGRPRVVFLGDSITDAWRLNQYFPDSDFINRGISGQITGEMLGRFKADVIDLKPAAVVILGGANDLARGINILVTESNYSMMADLAEKHAIKLIFASVLPVSDHHKDQNPAWEQTRVCPPVLIKALNAWMKAICEQRGCAYLDYYSALVDKDGQMGADLADDGIHPNSKGYRIMATVALAAVNRTLAPTSPQQKPKRRRLLQKDQ